MSKLIEKAREARKKAHAPYSGFKVGAALETTGGKIYTGCNIENASYGATCCAERTAIYKAISEGEKRFRRIAITAGTQKPCPPCGICRQVLFEFAPEIEVIMVGSRGRLSTQKLSDLLPNGFRRNNH